MRRFIPLILLPFLAACGGKRNDLSRFYEDGRAKPVVAITSMIDTTSFDLPWSLSEEFTTLIVNQMTKEGSLCVLAKDHLSSTENPFGSDLSWAKREFPDQEFVVFLELVEHNNVPIAKDRRAAAEVPFETSTDLRMAVRVRVVDLRGPSPRIVLQELLRDSYYIPKTLTPTDYKVVVWGTDDYGKSPMGIAHMQIVREVAGRVEEYIHLAKGR